MGLSEGTQRHGGKGRASRLRVRRGRPGHRLRGQYVHRRHVGSVAEERGLRSQGNRRCRLRADAQADLYAHGHHHRADHQAGRKDSRDHPRRPVALLLHQWWVGGGGDGHQADSRLLQAGGRAEPHQVHQPPRFLPRRNGRGDGLGRLASLSPGRLRAADARHFPCSAAQLLPLRVPQRDPRGVRRALCAGRRGDHQVPGAGDGGRRRRRAGVQPHGRGGPSRQLLAAPAGGVRQVRRSAHRRRGDYRLRAHRQDVRLRALGRHPPTS